MRYLLLIIIVILIRIEKLKFLDLNASLYDLKTNPDSKFCKYDHVSKDDVNLFAYVHSSPASYKKRMFIRETWASRSFFKYIRAIFVIGISSNNTINDQLLLESNIYKDILIGNFNDTYRNLTHKCVLSLKWINKNCQNDIDYVIKADDDTVFNLPVIYDHLKMLKKIQVKKTILCHGYKKTKIVRDPKKKWYVSVSELSGSFYLPYCVGFGLALSFDLINPMLNAIGQTSFFWIDDYFLFGQIANKVNAKFSFQNTKFVLFPHFLNKILFNISNQKSFNYYAFHADKNLTLMFQIWNKLKIT